MINTPRLLTMQVLCAAALCTVSASAWAQKGAAPSPANAGATAAGQPAPDHSASYYHFGLARMYEEQAVTTGRQDAATQAIEQYKLALNADPGSRMLQDGLANLYFRLGRIREAVSQAQEQVNKHPDDVDAHVLLGKVYLRALGDGQGPQSADMLQAAIKEYERIAQLKPNDLETHLLLGQLYGLNHDSAKAEAQFRAAQKIDPGSEDVVLNMARLYTEKGDLNGAAKVIADLPADDRTERMNFALGNIYDQLKQPKEAAAAYRAVLAEDAENTDAKRGLANALVAAGQTDAAQKVFADIVGSDPQDAQSLVRQAEIQLQKGQNAEALASLKKAEGLGGDSLELRYTQAMVYDAVGQLDEAIRVLQQGLQDSANPKGQYEGQERSNRTLFLDKLGNVYREQGKTDKAAAAYREMMSLGGESQARGAEGLIDTYRDAHQWNEAMKIAAEMAKQMPNDREVQLAYARQLGDAGKVDEALKVANAQLKGTPEDREVLFTVADIEVRAKRYKESAATLTKVEAMSAKPEDKVFLYYYRGSVAERQKQYDEAEADFKRGLAIDPNSGSILNDYGYMLAERGVRLPEALTMLKKAVESDPGNGAFLDSLGWVYFKMGQYALAETYAQRAAQKSPTDPAVLDHLGEIYAKNGKLPQAVTQWQKSVDEYATSLPPEADPADVAKVQKKLEGARVRLAHAAPVK